MKIAARDSIPQLAMIGLADVHGHLRGTMLKKQCLLQRIHAILPNGGHDTPATSTRGRGGAAAAVKGQDLIGWIAGKVYSEFPRQGSIGIAIVRSIVRSNAFVFVAVSLAAQIKQCSSEQVPSQRQTGVFILKPAHGHRKAVLSLLGFFAASALLGGSTATDRLAPPPAGLQLFGRGVAPGPGPAATGGGGGVPAPVQVIVGRGGPDDHAAGPVAAEDDGSVLVQAEDVLAEGDVQIRRARHEPMEGWRGGGRGQ